MSGVALYADSKRQNVYDISIKTCINMHMAHMHMTCAYMHMHMSCATCHVQHVMCMHMCWLLA